MNKEALLQETYDSAFNDELEKIAEDSSKTYAASAARGGAIIGSGVGLARSVQQARPIYKHLVSKGVSRLGSAGRIGA